LITYSFFIEFLTGIAASILIFVISFSFIPHSAYHYLRYIGLFVILLILLALNPFMANKLVRLINKAFKKNYPLITNLTYRDIIVITGLLAVSWLILGTGFFCLINSIYQLPMSDFLFTSGSFALATDIGILALFAPSGIGVREAVIIATMSQILPVGMASIISILARIWATCSELLWISMAFILVKIFRIRNQDGINERII